MWLANDEFSENYLKWAKGRKVLTTAKERASSRVVGRVARVHTARGSVTMGLILSPVFGVVRAYMIVGKLANNKKLFIQKHFGSMVDVMANSTGSVRAETHVDFIIPVVLTKAAKRVRNLLKLPADAPAIGIED